MLAIIKTMPSDSLSYKFILFFLATVASIAIGLNVKNNVNWQNYTFLLDR